MAGNNYLRTTFMKIHTLLLATSLFVAVISCKHTPEEVPGGTNKQDSIPVTTDDSVCFNTQIQPLINASCAQAGCHDQATQAEGINLSNYQGIKAIVNNGELMEVITETRPDKRMPPPPAPPLSAQEIQLIQRWINEGARNKICAQSNCDSSNVTYNNTIAPILNTYCKGCHNAGSAGGGVILDSYAAAKSNTMGGNVIGSVKAGTMPKGTSKLSACNIRLIEIWAEKGCPQ